MHLLVGEWSGRGVADFPTIDRVEYDETLRYEWDEGRSVLVYEQRAQLGDGTPSHRESGFIRPLDDGRVELWNAQNNGRTEVLRGSAMWSEADQTLTLEVKSVDFGNDERMLHSERRIRVRAGRLTYELIMATTTTGDATPRSHLTAELDRSTEGAAPRG
ncbi:MAG: FABP family protein [Gemmatimonadota bacterium]